MCSRSQAARSRDRLDRVLDSVIATLSGPSPAPEAAPRLSEAADALLEAGATAPALRGLPDVVGDAVRRLYQPMLTEAPPADMAAALAALESQPGRTS